MKRKKCANKICDNLSRNYEHRFCCIECAELHNGIIDLAEGDIISRDQFLQQLVLALYSRTTAEFTRSNFREKGEVA